MLNVDHIHLRGPSGVGDLGVCHTLLGVILHGEALEKRHALLAVLRQAAASEHDGALHIRRPGFVPDRLVAVHGEADLVALADGVDLVSGAGAVEIDPVGLLVIEEVDRDGVGVAVVAVHGENAPSLRVQELLCRFRADLFFFFRMGRNMVFPPCEITVFPPCEIEKTRGVRLKCFIS